METQIFEEPHKVTYSYKIINNLGQMVKLNTSHFLKNEQGKILELTADINWEEKYEY